jgi:predicted N-formylglutamate amidohydrolase
VRRHTQNPCLSATDPPPFAVERAGETSAFVLTCDHAGRRLPARLGNLGLSDAELGSHVAWDIGAAGLARQLAAALDAFLILQTYSRLVIDCNRPLESPQSIVTQSERTAIAANRAVSPADAQGRARDIFHPYHDRIRAELDGRLARRQPTVLVALHSFTPVFDGVARPWHAGVLYGRDARLGRVLLDLLRAEQGLVIGDNQPYNVSDDSDYAIPVHGEQRGIPHVELEIRNDLIADEAGQARWSTRLANALVRALPQVAMR